MSSTTPGWRDLTRLPVAVRILAAAIIYFSAARLSMRLTTLHESLSTVWPVSGLGVALLVLGGRRAWLSVLLGALTANLVAHLPWYPIQTTLRWWAGVAFGLGATAEAILGAWVFERCRATKWQLFPLGDAVACLMTAAIAPLASAIFGVTALAILRESVQENFLTTFVSWWACNALGLLMFLPLFVRQPNFLLQLHAARIWETLRFVLLTGGIAILCWMGFFVPGGAWFLAGVLPMMLLVVAWCGPWAIELAALVIAGFAITAGALGQGPFGFEAGKADLIWLQLLLAMVALTALLLPAFKAAGNLLWPGLVLVVGWTLSGWIFLGLNEQRAANDRVAFAQLTAAAELRMRERMQGYIEALDAGVGFVAARPDVSGREWREFAQRLDIARRCPGLRGIGLVFPVKAAEEEAFLQRVRADGAPGFAIKPWGKTSPDPTRERLVLAQIEPEALNRLALGLDVSTEPARARAAEESRAHGEPRMTTRVALIPDGPTRPGFVVLSPVYRGIIGTDEPAARRDALVAWIYAPFALDDFMAGAITGLERTARLFVFPEGPITADRVIYASQGPNAALPIWNKFDGLSRLELLGQSFILGWSRGPAFAPTSHSPMVWAAGAFALASFLLSALVLSALTTSDRAQSIAADRTAELRIAQRKLEETNRLHRAVIDGTIYSFISTDRLGMVVTFNAGAEHMLGYASAELVGKTSPDLLHARSELESRAEELTAKFGRPVAAGWEALVAPVRQGGADEREWTYVCKDGRRLPVLLTTTALRDRAGEVTGFLFIAQDLTERKKTEAALQASEERLSRVLAHADCLVWEAGVRLRGAESTWRYTVYPSGLYRRLFGERGPDENTVLWDWFDIPERDEIRRRAHEAIVERSSGYVQEFRVAGPDGRIWIRESVAIRPAEGDFYWLVGVAIDVTKQKDTEAVLQQSEERFRSAFDSAGIGMALVGIDGRWLRVNRTLCDIVGYSKQELLQQRTEQITHPEDLELDLVHTRRLLEGELRYSQLEKRFVHRDGHTVWIRLTSSLVRDPAGAPVHFIAQIEDVTARKQLEDSLAQARDAALAASRLKSEFLATMSHEIRTPMNGIIGMASLLIDTPLSAQQQHMSGVILRSAESLLKIINDILDFSKIEAGKLRLEPAEFDLRQVVEETLTLLAPRADEKRLELACDFDAQISYPLVGDAGRISQVLTNLVGNAIKFTDRGEVVVRVEQMHHTAERACFRVKVSDTGVGIPEQTQAELFQPFTQADGTSTRRFGGTGLGLAISRQLVELMGGDIGFESEVGQGSMFWFELDLPRRPNRVAGFEKLPPNLRVLAVDDNAVNRQILLSQLARFGLRAEAAEDGREALALLRAGARLGSAYQLALLDWHMPQMDGLALAGAIRADPLLKKTPLVMLSSAEPIGDEAALQEANFAALLAKPVREAQLHRCLLRVFDLYVAPRPVSVEKVSPGRPLKLLLAEDNPTNQQVIEMLAAQMGHTVECAANGRIALEKLAQIDYDAVLMDCQMPELDGYETTRRIRSGAAAVLNPRIPIIALTAYAMAGDRAKCLAAGMDDYLTKPVRADELREALRRNGMRPGGGGRPDGVAAENVAAPAPMPKVDPQVLDVEVLQNLRALPGRSGGRLLPELVKNFFVEEPQRRAELERLASDRDATALAQAAHAFAGSSAVIGARESRHVLLALEKAALAQDWAEVGNCLRDVRSSGERLRAAFAELEASLV